MDKKATAPSAPANKPQVLNTEQSKTEHKENQQYLIVMVIISVATLIVGGVIIYNLFKNYLHKTNEVKAQDIYINALEDKKKDLGVLKQNYKELQDKGIEARVYHSLPTRAEFKTILGVIENVSNKSGVTANVSSQGTISTSSSGSTGAITDDETTGDKPVAYGVSIAVEGTYDRIINFMENCVTDLRPLNFKSISISGSKDGNISASLVYESYYQGKADIENKTESLSDYLKKKKELGL